MKTERMIPNIYEQSFDMRTICRLFDIEMEVLEYYTNHILDCYSPEHCPKNLLPELAEHIGFDYQELKSVMYNRVVLKNFIKNLIRYRGSATGIGNAAAIDIRYRQTYPESYWQYTDSEPWVVEVPDPDAGKQIPMNYHESIDAQKTWIDVDQEAAIIYLFVIASDYFPKITPSMSDEEKRANFEERMRRLLDLSYLQEYVRPVGMYLLPMVAEKVNPYTDLTVKSVVIPAEELNKNNGIKGVPNATFVHDYDRMLYASVDNPDDALTVEPWARTLYHSQLAGRLTHTYYPKPVYHIEGKFLYYDHDELLSIYQDIQENVPGMEGIKIGDSLYNPNIYNGNQNYSYGNIPDAEHEPVSIQEAGKALTTNWPLSYTDNVGFPLERIYQSDSTIAFPVLTRPDEEYPIYLDSDLYQEDWTQAAITDDDDNSSEAAYDFSSVSSYLENAYIGTHTEGTAESDNGTNKNLMINLFTVDEDDNSEWTGAYDVHISGKGEISPNPVPYDIATNDAPTGDDAYWTVKNIPEDDDEGLLVP